MFCFAAMWGSQLVKFFLRHHHDFHVGAPIRQLNRLERRNVHPKNAIAADADFLRTSRQFFSGGGGFFLPD